jgi:hypothetical protein
MSFAVILSEARSAQPKDPCIALAFALALALAFAFPNP